MFYYDSNKFKDLITKYYYENMNIYYNYDDNKPKYKIELLNKSYSIEQCWLMLLSHIKPFFDENDCDHFIISMPSYFTSDTCNNIIELTNEYGLKCDNIIPTYVATSLVLGYENNIEKKESKLILLIEMGYSETSCSIIKYTNVFFLYNRKKGKYYVIRIQMNQVVEELINY